MRRSFLKTAGAYTGTLIGCYLVVWSSIYLVLSEGNGSKYFTDLFFARGGELAWYTHFYAVVGFIPVALVSFYFLRRGLRKEKPDEVIPQ